MIARQSFDTISFIIIFGNDVECFMLGATGFGHNATPVGFQQASCVG